MRFQILAATILATVLTANAYAQSNDYESYEEQLQRYQQDLNQYYMNQQNQQGMAPPAAPVFDPNSIDPNASTTQPAPKPVPGKRCFRKACSIWAVIDKTTQTMYLYVSGQLHATWGVSTGTRFNDTPNGDRVPDGRLYTKYSSEEHPGGGDYNGLGNMPYSVFIGGAYAIHGTPERNWRKLGRKPSSHGCIRLHPDNAAYFMKLVRNAGIRNVAVTIKGDYFNRNNND